MIFSINSCCAVLKLYLSRLSSIFMLTKANKSLKNVATPIAFMIVLLPLGLFSQNPNWEYPNSADFSHSASVVAVIEIDDVPANDTDDRIAWFVGTEIRGLSTPILVGSTVMHFVSILSNVSTENMTIKMFDHSSDQVYTLPTPYVFVSNNIDGTVDNPKIIEVNTNYNPPLEITNIPNQITIESLYFDTLNLKDYLIQPDPYPVVWSFVPNQNLDVKILDTLLVVQQVSGFTGLTTLTIKATEINGSVNQVAERDIVYQVDNDILKPKWNPILNQGIIVTDTFVDANLNVLEFQYDGTNLAFDYRPIILQADTPEDQPDWVLNGNSPYTMTFTVQPVYTPKYKFSHEHDLLAAFIDDQLVGVVGVDTITGLYFLSIMNDEQGDTISFKLYSGAMQKTLNLVQTYVFNPFSAIGSPANPVMMDFTPILPTINANTITQFDIIDSTFIGEVTFEFKAYDVIYPDYLYDVTLTKLCVVSDLSQLDTFYVDLDGDGFGSTSSFITACSLPEDGWSINNFDCNDNDPFIQGVMFSVAILENSGTPNDGIVCSGSDAVISLSGPVTYLWFNGQTTSSIQVIPTVTTSYSVTLTSYSGCVNIVSIEVIVEGSVVTSTEDNGSGSLRSILDCVADGGIIYYDQPLINQTILTNPLNVSKNVTVLGLSSTLRPTIGIDFEFINNGISILPTKILNLNNVDLRAINNTINKPFFTGNGQVNIIGNTKVIE